MLEKPLALQTPDPALRLRPVRLSDAGGLYRNCWPTRLPMAVQEMVQRMQRMALQGRGVGIVALDEAQTVVGYGQLTLWAQCGEISDLIVAAPYRGLGLGTAIVQYLMNAALEMKMGCVEIGAAVSNPRALTLYRRLGFRDHREVSLNLGKGNEPVVYLRLQLK